MSEIKVVDVMRNDQGLLVHEEAASTPNLNEKRRLASLDIFRGLTVAVSFFSLYLSISSEFSNLEAFTFYNS